MTFDELIERLLELRIELVEGTSQQLKTLKSRFGINHFPNSYTRFLNMMGNGTVGGFLEGSSCFYNELPFMKQWAEELLIENDSSLTFDGKEHVFWMSQGYMFAFFKLDEGNNPPVYFYSELNSVDEFVMISNSITEFLVRFFNKDKFLFHGS